MNKIKKFGLIGALATLPFLGFSQKDSTNFNMRLGLTEKHLGIENADLYGWSTVGHIGLSKYQNFEFEASFLKNKYSFTERPTITNINVAGYTNFSTNNEKKAFLVLAPGVEYSDIIDVASNNNEGKRTCEFGLVGKAGFGINFSKEKNLHFYVKRNFKSDATQFSVELGF